MNEEEKNEPKCPNCKHLASEHTLWAGCSSPFCDCRESYGYIYTVEYDDLYKKLEKAVSSLQLISELPETNKGFWKLKAKEALEEIGNIHG